MPLGKTSNPLLQQTEQAIHSKVPQNMQQFLQQAVTAGLTLIYSPALHQRMVQKLQAGGDPVQGASQGAANIVATLINQSKGQMPTQVAVPTAVILMCEILDFTSQIGKVQITPQLVAQATQATGAAVLQALKVSQQQMHEVLGHGMHQANMQGQAQQPPAAPSAGAGIIGSAMQGAQ